MCLRYDGVAWDVLCNFDNYSLQYQTRLVHPNKIRLQSHYKPAGFDGALKQITLNGFLLSYKWALQGEL